MSDLPHKVQAVVDAALETGRWTAEDPQRLQAFVDSCDPEETMRALADAMAFVATGMAVAHVPAKHMETVMEVMAEAGLLAIAAVQGAGE